jgi:hypothetical protein
VQQLRLMCVRKQRHDTGVIHGNRDTKIIARLANCSNSGKGGEAQFSGSQGVLCGLLTYSFTKMAVTVLLPYIVTVIVELVPEASPSQWSNFQPE